MAACSSEKSRFWFLIRLHILLLFGMFSSGASASSSSCGSGGSGCPVKATTHFIRRNMAFVGKTFAENSPSPISASPPPVPKHSSRQPAFINGPNHYIDPMESRKFLSRLHMSNSDRPPEAKRKKKRPDDLLVSGGSLSNADRPLPKHDVDMVVIGLSHHTAPVEVREKLSISEEGWNPAARDLCSKESIDEAVVLSTCNRFELYLTGRNEYEAFRDAIDYLHKRTNGTLDQDTLRRSLFMLSGEDAMWHLMRVSSGLDSLVVGESQILSQVKKAHEKSSEAEGCAGAVLHHMLSRCVSAGNRARLETGISRGAVSISSAAVEFTNLKINGNKAKGGFQNSRVVVIGAGKMARLLLINLQAQGVKAVTVVNRSPDRVKKLQVPPSSLVVL